MISSVDISFLFFSMVRPTHKPISRAQSCMYPQSSDIRISTLISNNQTNESNRLMSHGKLKLFFRTVPKSSIFFVLYASYMCVYVEMIFAVCVRVSVFSAFKLRVSIWQMGGKRGYKTLKSFSYTLICCCFRHIQSVIV